MWDSDASRSRNSMAVALTELKDGKKRLENAVFNAEVRKQALVEVQRNRKA